MDDACAVSDHKPSLWRDLRAGRTGLLPRLAASLVAGVALAAGAVLVLSIADLAMYHGGWIDDEQVTLALAVAAAVWCVLLTRIWATYRRYRKILTTTFWVLSIWTLTICAGVAADYTFRYASELVIAVLILAATALTIWLVSASVYYHYAGRAQVEATARLDLRCPDCGYSMTGLYESRCPECGSRWTLDELVARQEHARSLIPAATLPDSPVTRPVVPPAGLSQSSVAHPPGC